MEKKKVALIHSGTGSGPLCHRVLSIYLLQRVNIDDILCNVLGSWLGFLLYRAHYEMEGKIVCKDNHREISSRIS